MMRKVIALTVHQRLCDKGMEKKDDFLLLLLIE